MFDSGLLTLAIKHTAATSGQMPTEILVPVGTAYYGDRMVSFERLYTARGADCRIDRLVRVPWDTEVEPENYVVFEDESQYRVDAVADVIVKRSTRARELTLVKLEDLLNVSTDET